MRDDEEALIRQVQNGEASSYRILVENHKERLFSIAYSFTQNYEEAKDLSQEAFLKAWRAIRSFKFRSSFYTYIYRILVNLCKDRLRADKLKCAGSLDDEAFDCGEPASEGGSDADVMRLELTRRLDEAIGELPFKQKSAFLLKHIHGLSYEDIAKTLKCRTGTVKAHVHFAIMKLKKYLDKEP